MHGRDLRKSPVPNTERLPDVYAAFRLGLYHELDEMLQKSDVGILLIAGRWLTRLILSETQRSRRETCAEACSLLEICRVTEGCSTLSTGYGTPGALDPLPIALWRRSSRRIYRASHPQTRRNKTSQDLLQVGTYGPVLTGTMIRVLQRRH